MSIRLMFGLLVVAAAISVHATPAQAQYTSGAEQRARGVIERNGQFILQVAHTGASYQSLACLGRSNAGTGFNLHYQLGWRSSLTNNLNSSTFVFRYDANGDITGFSMSTTWPTGGFEIADIALDAIRNQLLQDPDVANNQALCAAIRVANAPNLLTLALRADQIGR